jgi:hypothetical protein
MRRSIVAGAAGLALLAAACGTTAASTQGPRGAATAKALRAYGGHAYRLGTEKGDYSTELIARQVRGGIAVLAVGYSFDRTQGLWSPALTITFYWQGSPLYRSALAVWQHHAFDYASGYRPICISSSGPMPNDAVSEYVGAGCTHPVFPIDVAAKSSLTAENASNGERYVVTSAGIILFSQSGASSEQ